MVLYKHHENALYIREREISEGPPMRGWDVRFPVVYRLYVLFVIQSFEDSLYRGTKSIGTFGDACPDSRAGVPDGRAPQGGSYDG